MGAWFGLISQIVDFVLKGLYAYIATEAGQKEWGDIEAALEVLLNNERNEGSVSYSVDNAAAAPDSDAAAAAVRGAQIPVVGKRYS